MKASIKNHLIVLSAAICVSNGIARTPSAELTPEEIAARRQSVVDLESHIAQREVRLAEWGRDIVELDARIEKRIDEIVKMLAGMQDSEQSRTRISNLKEDAIEALRRGNQAYLTKRRQVAEMIRTGDGSAAGDLAKFDEHIIKRVDQIAELTKSIPTHHDVEKYESGGGTYWNGYYNENTRISEEWKQNRRDTQQSDEARKEAAAALRETLDRLDLRRRSLKESLANSKLTPTQKDLFTSELGQIDAYEDHLRTQLRDITTATGGGGTPMGRNQAHDIERMFEDARGDLREDVARLFRAYDQFVRGRSYLANLNENLEARKKWLAENAPDTP